jgi:hypothetical protein
MTAENPCELWKNASKLANERKLPISNRCIYESVCDGSDCGVLHPVDSRGRQTERFTMRLRKTINIINGIIKP